MRRVRSDSLGRGTGEKDSGTRLGSHWTRHGVITQATRRQNFDVTGLTSIGSHVKLDVDIKDDVGSISDTDRPHVKPLQASRLRGRRAGSAPLR